MPCLLTQSTDHVPSFTASVFQGSLRRGAVFAADDSTVWSGKREDFVNEGPRSGCFWAVGSFVEIDEHDHGSVHWLVVTRPAPLEWLEVGIAGQRYELLHESMTVAEGAVCVRFDSYEGQMIIDILFSRRWPDATFCVLKKGLICDAESLTN